MINQIERVLDNTKKIARMITETREGQILALGFVGGTVGVFSTHYFGLSTNLTDSALAWGQDALGGRMSDYIGHENLTTVRAMMIVGGDLIGFLPGYKVAETAARKLIIQG